MWHVCVGGGGGGGGGRERERVRERTSLICHCDICVRNLTTFVETDNYVSV